MLRFSNGALAVRPRFYAAYNDLTIVVEDMGAENFYTKIMERILGNTVKIGRVMGVGGKKQVIERYENQHSVSNAIPEFYLVDGDFDELIGRSCPESQSFYRLNRYDIESFLVEQRAICVLAEEERPKKNISEHARELQLGAWKNDVVNIWYRLAACSALLQELDDREIRMYQSASYYCSSNHRLPDESEIANEIERVKNHQSVVTQDEFSEMLATMETRMGDSHDSRLRWISGKNVLLPLIIRLLHQHTGKNLKKESVCFRLAKYCEFPELNELRLNILNVVGVDTTELEILTS